jgi:hypothetical protein
VAATEVTAAAMSTLTVVFILGSCFEGVRDCTVII